MGIVLNKEISRDLQVGYEGFDGFLIISLKHVPNISTIIFMNYNLLLQKFLFEIMQSI